MGTYGANQLPNPAEFQPEAGHGLRVFPLPFPKNCLAFTIQPTQWENYPMKNNLLLAFALILAGLAIPVLPAGAQPATNPIVSVTKTSFTEVTSQLDPGGDFYMYLGTAQWLAHLSAKVEGWRHTLTSMPDAKTNDIENINRTFDLVTSLIKDSGIENLTGMGVSSIEIEPGLYRTKALLHHYPGQGDGFIWKLCGGQPHPLTGLDLLPVNTAFALFSDADLPLLWSVAKDEAAKSGFPQAQDFLQQLPDQFEKSTKLKWNDFLSSIGGEFGLVLTLDESNNVPVPLPTGLIQIPSPGIFLVVRVNDDTIFNRIADELSKNPAVVSVETNGLKMRTMPLPIPMAIDLRPTAASSGGYLIIASSDSLVREVLDVKAGNRPGLTSTAEFKRLSQQIPDQGNQFYYVSAKFGRAVAMIQQQVIANANSQNPSGAQMDWMKSFIRSDRVTFSYCVGMNTPEGCLTIGNGSQSAAAVALLPAVAVPGLLAAVAIPNFVKARAASQQNACINNLRQIEAAKQQWALEKNKTANDVPTEDDIKPYLMNSQMPVCPQGGTYTIGAVGDKPTCSIPGHVLR